MDEKGNELSPKENQPGLTLDYELYQQYLDDSDLSEAQKQEFIETLWTIIVSFVELGFGVHPLQQAKDQTLPLPSLNPDFLQSTSPDMIGSHQKQKDEVPSTNEERSVTTKSRRSA